VGANIADTSGVYPAELQAIARALAAFPLQCSLQAHSDSQASDHMHSSSTADLLVHGGATAVASQQLPDRSARSNRRSDAARARAIDVHFISNRLTDCEANTACSRPQSATPSALRELPLAHCKHHLAVRTEHGSGQQVIDNFHCTAIAQLCAQQPSSWYYKPPAE